MMNFTPLTEIPADRPQPGFFQARALQLLATQTELFAYRPASRHIRAAGHPQHQLVLPLKAA